LILIGEALIKEAEAEDFRRASREMLRGGVGTGSAALSGFDQ
jgi:hypothetical protein